MYYVRNLKEAKWKDQEKWSMNTFEDLHTSDCELSVWLASNKNDDEIIETALAITMTKDCFCNVWLCMIPTSKLKCYKFHIKRSDGDTKYERMKRRHVNIILPKMKDLLRLYHFLYKNWNLREDNILIKLISKTKLEQYFIDKVNNGEMDNFILDAILHKEEKAYKNYYKKLKKIPYAQAIIEANN